MLFAFPIALAGCESLGGGRLPESVIVSHEPSTGREYLLYRPVAYTRDQSWPLVVACHGGWGDSPQAQIKQWRELSDRYGFLVVAPSLEKQPQDERRIGSIVDHVRAGQSISDDRILMYGQGDGAVAALVTAAREPDVYRAVALSGPRFRVEDLAALNLKLDPYQPLYVRYNANDAITGKHVQLSVDWLRSNGADLRADTFGGRNPATGLQRIVEFYHQMIRTEAWVRIRATVTNPKDGMEFRFEASSSDGLQEIHWQFGDGGESTLPAPTYRYSKPGTHVVRLSAKQKKEPLSRTLTVSVPAASSTITPSRTP